MLLLWSSSLDPWQASNFVVHRITTCHWIIYRPDCVAIGNAISHSAPSVSPNPRSQSGWIPNNRVRNWKPKIGSQSAELLSSSHAISIAIERGRARSRASTLCPQATSSATKKRTVVAFVHTCALRRRLGQRVNRLNWALSQKKKKRKPDLTGHTKNAEADEVRQRPAAPLVRKRRLRTERGLRRVSRPPRNVMFRPWWVSNRPEGRWAATWGCSIPFRVHSAFPILHLSWCGVYVINYSVT